MKKKTKTKKEEKKPNKISKGRAPSIKRTPSK
jgi:hypothetical protein